MKKVKMCLISSIILCVVFFLLIVLLKTVDVKKTGVADTEVGLATFNFAVRDFIGVRMIWYSITDWLGVSGISVAGIFAVLGLVQWIKRKKILKVDSEILLLGCVYVIVMAIYVVFNCVIVNYRPIIINKNPEPSFPSSHTFITSTVMLTAIVPINKYFTDKKCFRKILNITVITITVFTVFGRVISGVHWATDIIGGMILCFSITFLYVFLVKFVNKK